MTDKSLDEKLIKQNIDKFLYYNDKMGANSLSELKTKYQLSTLTLNELNEEVNTNKLYQEFTNNLFKFIIRNNLYTFFINDRKEDIILFINNNHEKYSNEKFTKKESYIISSLLKLNKNPLNLNTEMKFQYEMKQRLFLNEPLLSNFDVDFENITRHNYANALKLKMIIENKDADKMRESLKNDIYFLYTTNLLLKRYPQVYNYYLLNETKEIIESSSPDAFCNDKDYKFYLKYANKTVKSIDKSKKEIENSIKRYYKK